MSTTAVTEMTGPSTFLLYIGIDVGKQGHVAALFQPPPGTPSEHPKFKAISLKHIRNSRHGFDQLLRLIRATRVPPTRVAVITESTGHYGHSLEEFLQEHGMIRYRVTAQKRYRAAGTTDQSDARSLVLLLHNQVGLRCAAIDEVNRVRRVDPPSPVAQRLRPLVQARFELTHEIVSMENRLTAIADEIFPELSELFVDPNAPSLLPIRDAFPTPEAIRAVTLDQVLAARTSKTHPGREKLELLQQVAAQSIGTRDVCRSQSLLIEQSQLIRRLQAARADAETLTKQIETLIVGSREGKILMSLPAIGPLQAAEFVAMVGQITNFDTVGALRRYCGWAPRDFQTGSSYDRSNVTRSGSRILKQSVFLITLRIIKNEPWKTLYNRLVCRMCMWDEKRQQYRGKKRVIGRVAGQLVRVIYTLLRQDADRVAAALAAGETLPEPILYDPKRHHIRP